MNKAIWVLVVVCCTHFGLYPLAMVVSNTGFPILNSKTIETIQDEVYFISFYMHVFFGGIALLFGWIGFIDGFRKRNLKLHRSIGKTYIISVFLSGTMAIYVATEAYGGMVSKLGFTELAVVWLLTTYQAYRHARNAKIQNHQRMMYYSYAITFAAVTFRIWNPLLAFILDDDLMAYQISSWICWIVNLLIAYLLIYKIHQDRWFRNKDLGTL